jgi:hypothetical protein
MAKRPSPKGCDICESGTPCEPCSTCQQIVHLGDWPFCNKRGGGHEAASRRRRAQCEPTVVYMGPHGEVGFVATSDPNSRSAKGYEARGYNRVEMPFYEARKFARQMNVRERRAAEKVLEAVYESEAELRASERAELRQAMQHMSQMGRDFARYAIERGNREEAEYYKVKDPGFYIEGIDG